MKKYLAVSVLLYSTVFCLVLLSADVVGDDDDDDDDVKCQHRTRKEALCNRECHSNRDCRRKKEICMCDGDCGATCVDPETRCPSPKNVKYASKEVSGRTFGSVVTYKCDSPRTLFGSENRTCRGVGDWDGRTPKCLISCGDPGRKSKTRSEVINSKSRKRYTAGSKVRYWCVPGFQMEGESILTCQEDGQWSSSTPSCKEGKCGAPDLPDNAQLKRKAKESYRLGDRVSMTCEAGYINRGNPRRECEGEEWSANTFYCKPKSCGDPGSPMNGRRKGLVFTFKARVSFECDRGYRLRGSRYRICAANQRWTGSQPTCQVIDCGDPPVPANGQIVGSLLSTTYGSKVKFQCNSGYTLHGAEERTCESNAWWTGDDTECREVKCPEIRLLYGTIEPTEQRTVGTTVKFVCNKEHVLVGRSEARCILGANDKGAWNQDIPSCKRPCNVSDFPAHTVTQGGYIHDSSMWFSCDRDYEHQGTTWSRCRDGSWVPKVDFQCKAPCEVPDLPKHGAQYGGRKHGQTSFFRCEGDYVFEGTGSLRCVDGEWDKTPVLTCKSPCKTPAMPPGMSKWGSSKHGGYMSFECPDNHVFEGTKRLRCNDGEWDKQPDLRCIALCRAPRRPINGFMEGADYRDGAVVSFSCEDDYLLQGEKTITCENGEWSSSEPRCLGSCTPPALEPNVKIADNVKVSYVEGDVVTLQCVSNSFLLEGESEVKCLNKVWSHQSPKCFAECSSPIKPENGQVKGVEYHHGAQVNFVCDDSYLLEGVPVITCNNGSWSAQTPNCTACSSLGMQDEGIKDSQIQLAGSSWSTPPSSVRLGSTAGWCINSGGHFYPSHIYMIVDLGKQYSVNAVLVKSVNSRGADFVISSKIADKDKFTSYQENGATKTLASGSKVSLKEPFSARYIKLMPRTASGLRSCLTVEVYGCALVSDCMRVGSKVLARMRQASLVPYESGVVTFTDENRIGVALRYGPKIQVAKTERFALILDKPGDKNSIKNGVTVLAKRRDGRYYKATPQDIDGDEGYMFFIEFGDEKWQKSLSSVIPFNEAFLCVCPPCKVDVPIKKACNSSKSPYDFGVQISGVRQIKEEGVTRTIEGKVEDIIFSKTELRLTKDSMQTFTHEMTIEKSCGCPQIEENKTYAIFGKMKDGRYVFDKTSLVEEMNDVLERKIRNRCPK